MKYTIVIAALFGLATVQETNAYVSKYYHYRSPNEFLQEDNSESDSEDD